MSRSQPLAPTGYGAPARSFHWLTVALLIIQFAVAWTMPEIHRGVTPDRLINLHLSFGTLILLVVLARLAWRATHPVPLVRDGVPAWQYLAAEATHLALYALLLVIPLLGWANASGRGWDIVLFGLLPLPPIMAVNSPIARAAGDIHVLFCYLLLGLVALHVAAGLFHHFVRHDDTLRRMLPRR